MKEILKKTFVKTLSRKKLIDGVEYRLKVKIRYNDECGNGHNSFVITADLYEGRKWVSGGCLHDEVAVFFPELRKYLKWHLMNEDGPTYYIANTMYYAKTRENMSLPLGAPTRSNMYLKFKGIPFHFQQQSKGFWDYLDEVGDWDNIDIVEIPYDGDNSYKYGPNYSFTGFIKDNQDKKWYKAPFKTIKEAEEFLEALRNFEFEIIKVPVEWNKPVIPNIQAAKECAVWFDATDEDILSEGLEQRLKDRLPNLIEEFAKDLKEIQEKF